MSHKNTIIWDGTMGQTLWRVTKIFPCQSSSVERYHKTIMPFNAEQNIGFLHKSDLS